MNHTRPRVLLDCDGVLADFVGGFLTVVNRQLGTAFRHEDITEFDLNASLGLTNEQCISAYDVVDRHGFATGLDAMPGAISGVRRLRDFADVYIVTSPWRSSQTWTHDRDRWLDRHFGIPSGRIIHTSAKHVCSGDVLVDDKTSTLDAWRACHPKGVAVQWSTPHNRRDLWDGPSTSSWGFLIDEIVMRRDRANATAHDIDDLGDGIVLGGEA